MTQRAKRIWIIGDSKSILMTGKAVENSLFEVLVKIGGKIKDRMLLRETKDMTLWRTVITTEQKTHIT